jgi:hypothetical protein
MFLQAPKRQELVLCCLKRDGVPAVADQHGVETYCGAGVEGMIVPNGVLAPKAAACTMGLYSHDEE